MHLTVLSLTHLHAIPKNPTKVNINTICVLQMKSLRIKLSQLPLKQSGI